MSNLSLAKYQKTMGLHLRDPEHEAAPENLNARRLGVYKELVFNNIESQLAGAFPVIKGIFDSEEWRGLVREFLRDYRSQTPYFTQLSAEFLNFLAQRPIRENTPPFLVELAHYERIEIDLFMQDEEFERVELDSDILSNKPLALVSATALLGYAFPVHQIAPEYQPQEAPESPTLLLLFQDDDGEVRFFELQPLAYQLVSKLQEDVRKTGIDLLKALAADLNIEFTEMFAQQGFQLLEQLNQLKVLRAA